MNNTGKTNLKPIYDVKKADGLITVKIKIFNIENMTDIFIINSRHFNYDFLIGLDCMQNLNYAKMKNYK